jgi:hypothetical protein
MVKRIVASNVKNKGGSQYGNGCPNGSGVPHLEICHTLAHRQRHLASLSDKSHLENVNSPVRQDRSMELASIPVFVDGR